MKTNADYKQILKATCNYIRYKQECLNSKISREYETYDDVLFYIKRKIYEKSPEELKKYET